LDAIGSPDLKSSIAIFGGKIGYNQQWNSYLVGLEGDISSFHFNRSAFTTGSPFAGFGGFANFNTNVSTTWLATIRPRIGYTVDRILLYATGGLALAHVSFSNTYFGLSPLGTGFEGEATSASRTKAGWAVGAGADYALTTNWIASIEYLHIELDSLLASGLVTTGSTASATFNFATKLQSDIVRGGVAYKF
jgi:outer membrane immunogenic protein